MWVNKLFDIKKFVPKICNLNKNASKVFSIQFLTFLFLLYLSLSFLILSFTFINDTLMYLMSFYYSCAFIFLIFNASDVRQSHRFIFKLFNILNAMSEINGFYISNFSIFSWRLLIILEFQKGAARLKISTKILKI